MVSIKTKIEAKMNEIRASKASDRLQTKIQSTIELQKSLKNPMKGKGSQILERLGEGLNQSGEPYREANTPSKAASVLLGLLSLYLSNGEHQLVYRNDSSLLISIDSQFYEIQGSELKDSVLKFARNAGVPFSLIGTELAKELISGIVDVWKRHDPNYTTGSRLIK